MAARARSTVVLRPGSTWPKRGRHEVPGEHAVQRRRRSGHRVGGGMRHRLPGGSRRGGSGRACACAKASRSAGRAIFFSPRKKKPRGSPMCGWRAAPFLLQRDGFSCSDAHTFNRHSSLQVTICVCPITFPLVSIGFSFDFANSSLFSRISGTRTVSIRRDNSLARFFCKFQTRHNAVT